jgi:hypothetical protein
LAPSVYCRTGEYYEIMVLRQDGVGPLVLLAMLLAIPRASKTGTLPGRWATKMTLFSVLSSWGTGVWARMVRVFSTHWTMTTWVGSCFLIFSGTGNRGG